MKTKMLLTVGAASLTVLALNITTSFAQLAPRAAGNEIIHVAGTSNDPNLVALRVTSAEYAAPRLVGNKAVVVTSASTEVNPATLCSQKMAASPKAIQTCAANPSAPMPCCAMAAK